MSAYKALGVCQNIGKLIDRNSRSIGDERRGYIDLALGLPKNFAFQVSVLGNRLDHRNNAAS